MFGQIHIEADTTLGVNQSQRFCRLYPVRLRRSNPAWSSRLQGLVNIANPFRYLATLLEMEALHISDGLIDTTDATRVAHCSFRTVTWAQVSAVDATDAYLSNNELLGALGMTGRYILIRRGKDFAHLGADVALTVRQRISVGRHGKQHPFLMAVNRRRRRAAVVTVGRRMLWITIRVLRRRRGRRVVLFVSPIVNRIFSLIIKPLAVVSVLMRQHRQGRSASAPSISASRMVAAMGSRRRHNFLTGMVERTKTCSWLVGWKSLGVTLGRLAKD